MIVAFSSNTTAIYTSGFYYLFFIMFNATTSTLAQLRAFASDNNIAIEGDRRRKQSYIDSITAWQSEGGEFEPAEENISIEELESFELPWEQPAASEVGFAPILLLVFQTVLVLLALPIILVGGLVRAIAHGLEKLFDWLAMPKQGRWGDFQALVLAV